MTSSRHTLRIAALFFCILLSTAAQAAPQLAISPLGYQVTQITAVPGSPRTFDITSRAGVVNLGDRATAVQAMLMSSSPNFVALDGAVSFGDVLRTSPLRPVISQDTFKLRITLPPRRDLRDLIAFIRELQSSFSWRITCANCGVNRPPVANAGADQTVYATQTVTLDGSGSTDPDGQALNYQWSFVSRPAGSTVALSSATAVKPTFAPDRDGNYVVQLIVSDGQLSSAADTVQVSTLNSAPVARAGADQSVLVDQLAQLDGSASSDIDGDSLTYAWSVVTAPAGSQASIANPAQVKPTFTPDLTGQYFIELIVDDGTIASAPDSMVITTTRQNGQPVASAGPDQTVHVGDTAHLDGTASSDPDGDALTYRWSLNARPTNSNSGLQGATSPSPTLAIDKPGTYVAQLIVADGAADSSPDTVSLSTTNSAPVASASAPASLHWNTTVQVDGSASTDVDGDALGFTWSILSRPAGSQAVFSDPNAIKPTFHADRPGVYVVQLVVNDGHVNSAPASASVTATNQAPVASNDSATTSANAAVDVSVLANDSDADGDTLSIASVTQPAHGAATIQGSAVHYVPASNYAGPDSFSYSATDGADTASANVGVTVTANNSAPTAVLVITPNSADVGTSVTLSFAGSSDPDAGDHVASYSITLRSAPTGSAGGGAGGTVFALNVPQSTTATSLTFVPDTAGSYSFELVAIDTHGASSSPASAPLTANAVTPPNQPPAAKLAITPPTIEIGVTTPAATLSFAGSSDPDAGDSIVQYLVTLTSAPAGSMGGGAGGQVFVVGTPVSTTQTSLAFVPDVAGNYQFSLVARDSHGADSSAATANLEATTATQSGPVATVKIDRHTVFLTAVGQTALLHAQLLDDQGAPVTSPVTWTSSAPSQISVDSSGRVFGLTIGSAMIFAEANGVKSLPTFVIVAEPQPGALLVQDSQVVSISAPLNLNPGDPVDLGTQYEVGLTGVATPPAIGTVVLALGSSPIVGKVVSTRVAGGTLFLVLELAALPDVLARYNFNWSIDLSKYPVVPLTGTTQVARPGHFLMRARTMNGIPLSTQADIPLQPFQTFECDGSIKAAIASIDVSIQPTITFSLDVSDISADASSPAASRQVLNGTEALDGSVTLKFNPTIKVTGNCVAQVQIPLEVDGFLGVLVMPALRLGVGAEATAELTAASASVKGSGHIGVTESLGFECSGDPVACTPIDDVAPDGSNGFKFDGKAEILHGKKATVTVQIYAMVGLDALFLLTETAHILEARLGPKQKFELAFEDDQAQNTSDASKYDLNLEGTIEAGSALKAAIKKLMGNAADVVNLKFKPVLTVKLSESPKGKSSADKTEVGLGGDKVTFKVQMDAATINYSAIGYNIDNIAIYRMKPNDTEFLPFATVAASPGQTSFTYVWTPNPDDLGENKFAFFVDTMIKGIPIEEIDPNSVLQVNVTCSFIPPQGSVKAGAQANSPHTAAANVCIGKWTGTAVYESRYKIFPNAHTRITTQVTWTQDDAHSFPQVGIFAFTPAGSSHLDIFEANNCVATVTPLTVPLDPLQGHLTLNRSTNPPTVIAGDGAVGWLGTVTDCDGHTQDVPFTATYMETPIDVNAAGDTIAGHFVLVDDETVTVTEDVNYMFLPVPVVQP
ncbi:MAG: PKD domain-containing protein [Steroidobacteraceae bacterium]